MDHTLLESPDNNSSSNTVAIVPNATNNDGSTSATAPATPKSDNNTSSNSDDPLFNASQAPQPLSDMAHDEEETQPPSIVIYLVEPFTMGGSDRPEMQRLACLALLRCFQSVLSVIPDHIRSNISVQIISQESIVDINKSRNREKQSDHMKALALNVFSQCRRLLIHTSNIKSLTGFGTAAMADLFLKSKDVSNFTPFDNSFDPLGTKIHNRDQLF